MRAQKRLVVAVYGASCTGKSTSARILVRLRGCALRSDGEGIRARSIELKTKPSALTLDEHRKIDETTRYFAASGPEPLVIEGTFLDALLSDIENIRLGELVCADHERQRRYGDREGSHGLLSRDNADQKLRYSLHVNHKGTPDITIDTTSKTPEEVAGEIVTWIQSKDATEERS